MAKRTMHVITKKSQKQLIIWSSLNKERTILHAVCPLIVTWILASDARTMTYTWLGVVQIKACTTSHRYRHHACMESITAGCVIS